jgi:hypothetical protein
MKITFSEFKGAAPKFDKEQLADGYSAESLNARAGRGILEPYRDLKNVGVAGMTDPVSLFKYRNEWFAWSTPTYAVKAPLKNDPYDYAVIASAGSDPQMTTNEMAETGSAPFPNATIPLGVPQPSAPTAGAPVDQPDWVEGGALPDPAPTDDEYDLTATAYAICYVDAFGRLSSVSELSDVVEIREYETRNTQQVTVSMPSLPVGLELTNATRGTTAKIRLYRTTSTGIEGILQFVAELDYTATEYVDTKYSGDLGDVPINETWNPPPSTDTALFPNGPMRKVCIMGSDFVVGHNDKLVCFAEPGAFYAYPPEYYKVFQEKVITIVPAGSNLIVLTDMFPYVVEGSHPSSMEPVRLGEPVPCLSEVGVTEVAGAVYYVGKEGLWEVNGYTMKNVTRNYFSLRDWESLDPSTVRLANYDGAVFIFSELLATCFVYDPRNPDDALRQVDVDAVATAQADSTNDLVVVERGSNVIAEFDSHESRFLPLSWESKTYTFNEPLNFPMMKVKANRYPVNVTVECEKADGSATQISTRTVTNGRFVYLPFQSRSYSWRCRVTAPNPTTVVEVRSIELAQTPSEFE